MMSMMHSQIIKAINSPISERVIPEIQNIMNWISSGNRDTESGLSSNIQENGTSGSKTKITKKGCRSAFDLRDTEDLSSYIFLADLATSTHFFQNYAKILQERLQ